jgi:hypothetical protein
MRFVALAESVEKVCDARQGERRHQTGADRAA